MEERLQKIIAQAGLCSRRAAERLIKEGRVKVNGQTVDTLGVKADPARDRIEVDGKVMGPAEHFRYFMFYKPAGFLTTLNDPQGRPTVAKFLENLEVRVFPVGRLDMDVEGLLLLTNDGELSKRLMHPSHHVPKTYRVKVVGVPSKQALAMLAGGELMIGEKKAALADVEVIKSENDRTWLKLTLFEGRKRQVKRMCSAINHPVLKLKRESFGPLSLGRLKEGAIRELTPKEVAALKKAAGMV